MTHKDDKDIQKIKELIEIMEENDLAEIEIAHDDDKIHLKRFQPQSQQVGITAVPMVTPNIPTAPASGPGAAEPAVSETAPVGEENQEDLTEIKSPIVGTFYAKPSPDSETYVEIGSQVEPQTVVCIIEAMKVMNEIKAEVSGTIVEILVTNGQAVEYGQVLFKVKPE